VQHQLADLSNVTWLTLDDSSVSLTTGVNGTSEVLHLAPANEVRRSGTSLVITKPACAGIGGGILHSEIHKLIMLIWNKEELPLQWKESIVVPIHKKGDKSDCSNYRGINVRKLTVV
jgi:hypothetical protein